jgi:hypothetical protein
MLETHDSNHGTNQARPADLTAADSVQDAYFSGCVKRVRQATEGRLKCEDGEPTH